MAMAIPGRILPVDGDSARRPIGRQIGSGRWNKVNSRGLMRIFTTRRRR
jgi:hypothetical protein